MDETPVYSQALLDVNLSPEADLDQWLWHPWGYLDDAQEPYQPASFAVVVGEELVTIPTEALQWIPIPEEAT